MRCSFIPFLLLLLCTACTIPVDGSFSDGRTFNGHGLNIPIEIWGEDSQGISCTGKARGRIGVLTCDDGQIYNYRAQNALFHDSGVFEGSSFNARW